MDNSRPITGPPGPPDPPVFDVNGATRQPAMESQLEVNRRTSAPMPRPGATNDADARRRQGGL